MKKWLVILLVCLFLAGCSSPAESLSLWVPDSNAEHWEVTVVQVPKIAPGIMIEQLRLAGVLNDDVRFNRFTLEDGAASLDFNAAFSQQVNSMGTAGEIMILGSVVNTFLTAFDIESLTITVDGEVLETGHNIYDIPFGFFE